MRSTHRCPKCGTTRLYVVHEVRQPDEESSNGIHTVHVTTAQLGAHEVGVSAGTKYRTHAGTFEAWVCSRCGLTEWYARDPEQALEKLSQIPGSGVTVVSGPPGGAPFR